jgi:hypothetical protein
MKSDHKPELRPGNIDRRRVAQNPCDDFMPPEKRTRIQFPKASQSKVAMFQFYKSQDRVSNLSAEFASWLTSLVRRTNPDARV